MTRTWCGCKAATRVTSYLFLEDVFCCNCAHSIEKYSLVTAKRGTDSEKAITGKCQLVNTRLQPHGVGCASSSSVWKGERGKGKRGGASGEFGQASPGAHVLQATEQGSSRVLGRWGQVGSGGPLGVPRGRALSADGSTRKNQT